MNIPGMVINTLNILTDLIFLITLNLQYYSFHLKMETSRHEEMN